SRFAGLISVSRCSSELSELFAALRTSAASRTAGSPAAMVRKTIAVESGGMVVQGRAIPEINDKNDEMLIAVAAVTVIVDNEDT
ncbi:MAG: Lin0512 family protein, partial [Hormoscilla sp. SP12CHS1]|nr:Lin0512 family protein [Hormoscilla sp. SP12CHS1]